MNNLNGFITASEYLLEIHVVEYVLYELYDLLSKFYVSSLASGIHSEFE